MDFYYGITMEYTCYRKIYDNYDGATVLSGMSLECIVFVLMNNSLLGGQFCSDYLC